MEAEGSALEDIAQVVFAKQGVSLSRDFSVPVGAGSERRKYKFDLGCDEPPLLVECKAHSWTTGGNAPNAKLKVWNEAMYYFACAPLGYRKVLFVLHDERRGESLAAHYVKRWGHLIPDDVEIWEFDPITGEAIVRHTARLEAPPE